jgi:purine-nucleoside phosphorylase
MGTADLGIILGSGLDEVHAMMEDQMSLEYDSIPHMTVTTAPGHTGMLRFGRIGEMQVLVFCGRFHYYEGHPMWRVVYPVRIIQALGVPRVLVTAAAGGLNDTYTTGDLVLVNDHINLMPDNPLRGLSDPRLGDRFPDMTDGYNKEWRHQIMSIAADLGITLKTGIYAGLQGPNLETQAECDFLRRVGADLVGMSVVPEIITGVQAGIRMAALCVISNMAWHGGKGGQSTVEEILAQAQSSAPVLASLIRAVCTG